MSSNTFLQDKKLYIETKEKLITVKDISNSSNFSLKYLLTIPYFENIIKENTQIIEFNNWSGLVEHLDYHRTFGKWNNPYLYSCPDIIFSGHKFSKQEGLTMLWNYFSIPKNNREFVELLDVLDEDLEDKNNELDNKEIDDDFHPYEEKVEDEYDPEYYND